MLAQHDSAALQFLASPAPSRPTITAYAVSRNAKSTLRWIVVGVALAIAAYMVWRDPEGVYVRLRDVWEAITALFPGRG